MSKNLKLTALASSIIRARTRDHQTFDTAMSPLDQSGNMRGKTFDHNYKTHDGRTADSTGAFLVGELERLDQTLHMPLAAVTWSRDVDLREDVSLGDEVSSFTLTTFGSGDNVGNNGKSWIGKSTSQIGGIGVDQAKIPGPLTPWALEVKYSILELESAAKMGRPIDDQKIEGLKLKHQMDIDEQVYIGDAALQLTGLCNSALVSNVSNVPNGAAAASTFISKTPDEILADVNAIIISAWAASGWSVMPTRLLLPPVQFGYLSTQKIGSAGQVSILKFLLDNNVLKSSGKGELEILPAKWLTGRGAGATDRMMAYTKEKRFARYPMTPLQRTPIQYDSIYHKMSYYCRLGAVEVVYPETFAYRDGI